MPFAMDLLISYSWSHFQRARREAIRILQQFGDQEPRVQKTSVAGIAVAHSTLNNRDVVRRCRELLEKEPAFEFAIKWVPVDFWCETDLAAMKELIDKNIKDQIEENQTWAMKVEKRRWQQYHTIEIVDYLAAGIESKVDLRNPDRILRVDVLGNETAISLLKPDEIFSVGL